MSINPELTEQLSPHTAPRQLLNTEAHQSPKQPPDLSINQSTEPLYKVWPARSKALYQGRILLGVHWLTLLANVLITLVALICFIVWVAQPIHWLITLIACLIGFVTEALLLKAALMDPGIVCRQTPDRAEDARRDAFERVRNALISHETRRAIGLPPISPYTAQDQSITQPDYQIAGYPAPLQLATHMPDGQPITNSGNQSINQPIYQIPNASVMPDESQIITLNAPDRSIKQPFQRSSVDQPTNQSVNQSIDTQRDVSDSVIINVDGQSNQQVTSYHPNNQPNQSVNQPIHQPFSYLPLDQLTNHPNNQSNQSISPSYQTYDQSMNESFDHLPPPFPPLVYGPGTGLTPDLVRLSQQYVVPCQRVARRSINQSVNQSTNQSIHPSMDGVVYDLIPLKYCSTCCIYRPHGASHCRDCDQCVTQFDHHCPWISNCVGSRNHRWFVGFIFALTVLTLYVFAVCLYQLINAGITTQFDLSTNQNVVSLVLTIFCFVIGWCMISLSVYHVYLIVEQTTTNKDIKARRERQIQSINQSTNHSSSQSINQPNNQSVDCVMLAGVPWSKREPYPPIELPDADSFTGAISHFFCSPLPAPLIDMRAACVVDERGQVVQYPLID